MFEELGLNVARQADNGAQPAARQPLAAGSRATPPPTRSRSYVDSQAEAPTSGIPRRSCACARKSKPPAYPQRPSGGRRPSRSPLGRRLSRHGGATDERHRRAPRAAAPSRASTAACGWSPARRARACCSTASACCCCARTTTSASPTTRKVREAAADAAMRYGVGAGASRLVSGNMTLHRRLEERLADFEGTERCVLFGSGYLANAGRDRRRSRGQGDVVFSDALNHASIIDGCRLARAETFVYDHLDTEHLEWGLREARGPRQPDRHRRRVLDGRRRRAARARSSSSPTATTRA